MLFFPHFLNQNGNRVNVKLLEWLEVRVETMREKFFYPFKGKEYFEMRTNSEVMVNIMDTI